MQRFALPTIVLALAGPAILSAELPAMAQVTIDLRALDAVKPAPHRPAPAPARGQTQRNQANLPLPLPPVPPTDTSGAASGTAEQPANPSATVASPSAATPPAATATPARPAPTAPPAAPPPAATLPTTVPPTADLKPVAPPPPPATAEAPPPKPPVSDTATTAAAPTDTGMRLTFGSDEVTLNPASVAAIKAFVAAAPGGDTSSYNVVAYAAGKSDDPSVARRLSLSRALAVRSTLMAEGVASTRIYVRALGAQAGSGPPDRVDITLLGANVGGSR